MPRHRWTPEEIANLRQRYKDGESLKQIADDLHLSRQRVSQLVMVVNPRSYKTVGERSVYPGLNKWMTENRITYVYLSQLMGYALHSGNQTKVRKLCLGKAEFHKKHIDKLIKLTGKSYEYLFGR